MLQVKWVSWMANVVQPDIPPEMNFSDIIVPTMDLVRGSFVLEMLLTNNKKVYVTAVALFTRNPSTRQQILTPSGGGTISLDLDLTLALRCVKITPAFVYLQQFGYSSAPLLKKDFTGIFLDYQSSQSNISFLVNRN